MPEISKVDNNRIGSHCWYCRFDYTVKKVTDWSVGFLRAWSTDHEEYDTGPGPFPVGVIEDEKTGMCHAVSVSRICFAAIPPNHL